MTCRRYTTWRALTWPLHQAWALEKEKQIQQKNKTEFSSDICSNFLLSFEMRHTADVQHVMIPEMRIDI